MRKLIHLLKQEAVNFGEFVLSSGARSNYYIDVKKASTNPVILREIVKQVKMKLAGKKVDRLAGPAIGAIPIVTATSLETNVPFIIVRKKKKRYGAGREIDGVLNEGDQVIIIEDVTTTGATLLSVAETIIENRGEVREAIVVVDRLEGAKRKLAEENIKLNPILTVRDLGIEPETQA